MSTPGFLESQQFISADSQPDLNVQSAYSVINLPTAEGTLRLCVFTETNPQTYQWSLQNGVKLHFFNPADILDGESEFQNVLSNNDQQAALWVEGITTEPICAVYYDNSRETHYVGFVIGNSLEHTASITEFLASQSGKQTIMQQGQSLFIYDPQTKSWDTAPGCGYINPQLRNDLLERLSQNSANSEFPVIQ